MGACSRKKPVVAEMGHLGAGSSIPPTAECGFLGATDRVLTRLLKEETNFVEPHKLGWFLRSRLAPGARGSAPLMGACSKKKPVVAEMGHLGAGSSIPPTAECGFLGGGKDDNPPLIPIGVDPKLTFPHSVMPAPEPVREIQPIVSRHPHRTSSVRVVNSRARVIR